MHMSKPVYTPPPHLKEEATVSNAMRDVMIALIPIVLVAVYFFGLPALFTIVVCLAAAALTELIFRKAMSKKPALNDYSALLTGLLVALLFPATTPWWEAALATFIAVGIVKELMGGLGWNRFNPALLGRVSVFLIPGLYAWINTQFAGLQPAFGSVDVVTQATPLAMMHQGMELPSYLQLFLANPGGAMGEVSPLALLLGGAFLVYKKHINWKLPAVIIGVVLLLSLVLMPVTGVDPLQYILTGGLFLGAIFMATDWVTSPITAKGKIIFGICIGVLIVVFRGIGPVEGVAFAILIMNAFVPLIERATKHPSFSDPKPAPAGAEK